MPIFDDEDKTEELSDEEVKTYLNKLLRNSPEITSLFHFNSGIAV